MECAPVTAVLFVYSLILEPSINPVFADNRERKKNLVKCAIYDTIIDRMGGLPGGFYYIQGPVALMEDIFYAEILATGCCSSFRTEFYVCFQGGK